jgi:hypothetical protein
MNRRHKRGPALPATTTPRAPGIKISERNAGGARASKSQMPHDATSSMPLPASAARTIAVAVSGILCSEA